jgi:hypothetical protein
MRRRGHICLALMLAATAAGCLVACGNGSSISQEEARQLMATWRKSQIGKCLADAGAHLAGSRSDIDFFLKDVAHDRADQPGFAYDRKTKAFVQVWRSAPSNPPIRWLLWQAQPFEADRSVEEIVGDPTTDSWVAYVHDAPRNVFRRATRCITF